MLHTLRTSFPSQTLAGSTDQGVGRGPGRAPGLGRIRYLVAALGLAAASCAGGPGFDVEQPAKTAIPLQQRLGPEDGAIVSVVGVSVSESWATLPPDTQARFGEEIWTDAKETLQGRADLVTYSSDSLRIGSFLVRPKAIEGRRLGAVILNRDGIASRGLDENELLVELSQYAARGYVAAASTYRGNRISQGVDEFGGDDVRDVLALATLLQRLDYVDPNRLFMVGFGRGGLMTYRALELGAPIRAAAVISGPADLSEVVELDPEIENGFEDRGGWPGLAKLHSDWNSALKADQLRRRSPLQHVKSLTTPLLVVHGRLDERVPVSQAMSVVTSLQEAGIPVEAMIYGYGEHSLLKQRTDWQSRVLDWIDRHDSRALFN